MPTATSASDLSPEDYPTINHAFTKPGYQFGNARVDWKETPEIHLFKVDLPGVKKEGVKLEVERGRILQFSGEWNGEIKEAEKTDDTWHCSERSSGKFVRRFKLPKSAKMDQIKAGMENGVLTVIVPKEEAKAIEISDDAHNLVVTVTTVPQEGVKNVDMVSMDPIEFVRLEYQRRNCN